MDFRSKDLRGGCSLELVVRGIPAPGSILFDSRNSEGAGILVRALDGAKIEVTLSDARCFSSWTSDAGGLAESGLNHVCMIVDGGPKLILFVINGELCDGGDDRQFGWGRYNRDLRDLAGAPNATLDQCVLDATLHGRALRVSEAVHSARHAIS
jgi:hypothetical protein